MGTTSPSQRLSVQGTGLFSGDLRAANVTATGTITGASFTGSGVATSTLTGGLSATGLASSAGVTLTGGSILSTSAATSTLANGINLTAGCFAINGTCVGGAAAAGNSGWTDGGTLIRLSTITDAVSIGTSTELAKLAVEGDEDAVEFLVRGISGQATDLVKVQNNNATDVFKISPTGTVTVAAAQSYTSAGALTVSSAGAGNNLTFTTGGGFINTNADNIYHNGSAASGLPFSITNYTGYDMNLFPGSGTLNVGSVDNTPVGITATSSSLIITASGAGNNIDLVSGGKFITTDAINIYSRGSGELGLPFSITNSSGYDIDLYPGSRILNIGGAGALATTTINATSSLAITATGASSLLALDSGNGVIKVANADALELGLSTTDLSGAAGRMFYNTTSGTFRCFQGGAWVNCVGASGGAFYTASTSDTLYKYFRLFNTNYFEVFGIAKTANADGVVVGLGTSSPTVLANASNALAISGSLFVTGSTTLSNLISTTTISVLGTGTSTITDALVIGTTTANAKLTIAGQVHTIELESAASTLDWSRGNQQRRRLTANTTFALTNGQSGGAYRLVLCQDSTGSRLVTSWGTNVLWAGGTAPTLTTTGNKCDVLSFIYTTATGTPVYLGASTLNF